MKGSKLIEHLNSMIEKHGDNEVVIDCKDFWGDRVKSTVERIDVIQDKSIGKCIYLDWRC